MTIERTFTPGPAIIEPNETKTPLAGMPETIITPVSWEYTAILNERYGLKRFAVLVCGDKVPVFTFEYRGRTFGFYRSMLGGPAAALLLEEMIALGAKRFIFFGSCGSLDHSLTAGNLIVPTAALRDEGTSYHYAPADDFIRVPTADRMAAILTELNVPFRLAKTWTTDAFYRETRANAEDRKARGCSVVEMECASVMAVGAFRGVDVYQFLYATDSLAGDAWDSGILSRTPEALREKVLDVALETAYRL